MCDGCQASRVVVTRCAADICLYQHVYHACQERVVPFFRLLFIHWERTLRVQRGLQVVELHFGRVLAHQLTLHCVVQDASSMREVVVKRLPKRCQNAI